MKRGESDSLNDNQIERDDTNDDRVCGEVSRCITFLVEVRTDYAGGLNEHIIETVGSEVSESAMINEGKGRAHEAETVRVLDNEGSKRGSRRASSGN